MRFRTSQILRLLTILFVLFGSVACDQVAKSVARETLAGQPPVSLLAGFLRLEYAENSGAFLSLGARLPAPVRSALLIVLVGAVLAGGLVYLLRSRSLSPSQLVGLSLVLGGGVGNLVDRVLRGGVVVDFAVLSLGPLHTGVFNVADLALMGGLAVFIVSSSRLDRARAPKLEG